MHYLHCVLVRFEDTQPFEEPIQMVEDLADEARRIAIAATEDYQGQVFDWRSEDAGRWADEFPRRGVVLGLTDREQFLQLLEEWKDKPLQNALEYLNQVQGINWGWRTQEQLRKDGAQVFPSPQNGKDGLYWSAIPVSEGTLKINEKLLKEIWADPDVWAYLVHSAVALVVGDYLIESQFYSVPDESPKISDTTLEDAKKHPEEYALVFLDYHW